MDYTPEPWNRSPGVSGGWDLQNDVGRGIGWISLGMDAKRITACINACRGMDTAWLEEHGATGWTEMLNGMYEEGFEAGRDSFDEVWP